MTSDQIIQRLRPKVAQVEGVKFFMQSGQDISVGGRLSRTLYQYTLTDTDVDELNHWAPIIEAAMRKLPELQDVASDQQIAAPHVAIEIDRDAASRLGISPSLIDETLYDAFGQRQVATIYTSTNQYKVILEVQPEFQEDPTALSKIYVAGPGGAQMPLSAFAHFTSKVEAAVGQPSGAVPGGDVVVQSGAGLSRSARRSTGSRRLQRELRVPPTLDGVVPGHGAGVPGLAVIDAAARRGRDPRRLHRARHALRELHPPDHDPLGVAFGRRRRAARADAAALRSERDRDDRRHSADRHRQEERDHDDRLRAAGGADRRQEPAEAIHQACLLRFRPIMMTTFAALFGALPIAVGDGRGSELRRPLGIAIVGGLLVSQWLTLYTTPVIYLYLERFARWLGGTHRRQSRLAAALTDTRAAPAWRQKPPPATASEARDARSIRPERRHAAE